MFLSFFFLWSEEKEKGEFVLAVPTTTSLPHSLTIFRQSFFFFDLRPWQTPFLPLLCFVSEPEGRETVTR